VNRTFIGDIHISICCSNLFIFILAITGLFIFVMIKLNVIKRRGVALTMTTTIPPCYEIVVRVTQAVITAMSGLTRTHTQNCSICRILNATLNCKATEDLVCELTGLTCRLLHAVAYLLVPVVSKVLPSPKSNLKRLSLVHYSNLPPSLQATGEMPLSDIDEDIIFIVGHTPRASSTTSLGLAFGVHGRSPNLDQNLDGVKNLDPVAGHRIQIFHKNTKERPCKQSGLSKNRTPEEKPR
jgi:hypothetical protein